MLNKTQKIAISKNFIISMLFICLIFAAFGLNMEDTYAVDLNESGNGAGMELNVEDKLENSQNEEILEVDINSGEILSVSHIVDGRTFRDIQNKIDGAHEGDSIILYGEYRSMGYESTISVNKRLTISSTSSATLNGNDVSGILFVENNARGTQISNLKFINANKKEGSALYINAKDVVVDNCCFENNHAKHGGVLTSRYNLYIAENVTVKNCNFTNNSGYSDDLEFANAGAVGLYGMNSRLINCIFDSNWIKNNGSVFGGALQIGLDDPNYKALVYNCTFINNRAIDFNGNSHGGAGCVRNGVEYIDCVFINNSAGQGGALSFHASGKLQNCIFINNTATYYYGGAVATGFLYDTMEIEIDNCYFEGNDAPKGGAIQALGLNIDIADSNFTKNHADTYGGALNIEAVNVKIRNSNFDSNIAEVDGGAIYTKGNDTLVSESSFRHNKAVPDYSSLNDGLGGAIYINSTQANVVNSQFYYNTARNGSAIYYDKCGDALILTNNTLFENQAWVYALPIYANDIYYGEAEELKSIIHGGNNIAKYNNLGVSNAIYNAADYSKLSIDGESPVDGATNSGKLYQDDREYNMGILVTVKKDDGTLVYNETLNSDYLGAVSDELYDLQPGRYYVTAKHIEDTYYKAITNTTSFNVIPKIDSQIRKLSSSDSYDYDEVVVWTLNITNNGPNKATNVTVNDILPEGLIYIGDDTDNKYNPVTGILKIGDLEVGKSIIVNIYARVNKTGEIVNRANVTSNEFDIDLSNNHDEATINVPSTCDLEVKKSVNKSNPKYGESIKWTIVVRNNGPDVAHNVKVTDILPVSLIEVTSDGNYNIANGIWNIGTLGVNKEVKLNIFCRVNATGTIKNSVSVKGKEVDQNMSNNNDSEVIKVASTSDLAIEKSINVSKANYADEITWKLVIVNNGPDNATGVKITDVLPDGLVYVDCVLERGKYSNGIIDVGKVAVGERLTFRIVCKVNKTGTITNVASVKGNQADYNLTNNEDKASVYINAACDLEVVKAVNVSNPNYGDNVTWTITVKNNGPDNARNVVITDLLPKSLIWVSDNTNGKYDSVTGEFTLAQLNRNKIYRFEIVTQVNATGIIQNNVSVRGSDYDYNPSNNHDSAVINVSEAADVGVVKLVNNSNPDYGDIIKWIIIAKNNGPDKATSVLVDDILPDGLILKDANASKGFYDNGIWNVCCLENGEEQYLEIVCMVNKTGLIINIASITAHEFDFNKSNNRDTESINVPLTVDLEVLKEVSKSNPYFGETIVWFISIRNNGPDNATDVVLYDLLDEGLEYSDSSSTVGTFDGSKWLIDRLNNGDIAYLNITCAVNKLGNITNNAFANSSEVDRNKSNNNDSEKITVYPLTDLAVVKWANNSNPNYLDLIKWAIIVSNNGPNNATGVIVRDFMPEGLEMLESSEYIDENGKWYVGDLSVYGAKELEIICRVISTGVFSNMVIVSGNEGDPYPDNNEDVSVINVASASDLSITKTVSKYYYKVGDAIDYSIRIANNGPDEAQNVKVNEILDPLLTLKSFKTTKGSYDEKNQIWKIDALEDGESAELYIKAMAAGEGIFRNIVSATSDSFDYDLDNNDASVDVNVSKKDRISNETIDEGNSNNNLSVSNGYLPVMHVAGNPFAILLVSVVFSMIFLGRNFSKKR